MKKLKYNAPSDTNLSFDYDDVDNKLTIKTPKSAINVDLGGVAPGTTTDVKINDSSITSNNIANIQVAGVYDENTNKIATQSSTNDLINDAIKDFDKWSGWWLATPPAYSFCNDCGTFVSDGDMSHFNIKFQIHENGATQGANNLNHFTDCLVSFNKDGNPWECYLSDEMIYKVRIYIWKDDSSVNHLIIEGNANPYAVVVGFRWLNLDPEDYNHQHFIVNQSHPAFDKTGKDLYEILPKISGTTNVLVNGTSITNNNNADIQVDGDYNENTNKIATQETVNELYQSIPNSAYDFYDYPVYKSLDYFSFPINDVNFDIGINGHPTVKSVEFRLRISYDDSLVSYSGATLFFKCGTPSSSEYFEVGIYISKGMTPNEPISWLNDFWGNPPNWDSPNEFPVEVVLLSNDDSHPIPLTIVPSDDSFENVCYVNIQQSSANNVLKDAKNDAIILSENCDSFNPNEATLNNLKDKLGIASLLNKISELENEIELLKGGQS